MHVRSLIAPVQALAALTLTSPGDDDAHKHNIISYTHPRKSLHSPPQFNQVRNPPQDTISDSQI